MAHVECSHNPAFHHRRMPMEGEGDTLFPSAVVRSCDEATVCSNMSGRVAEVMGLLCQSVEDGTDHSLEL